MSKPITTLARPIDPEFAAVYEEASNSDRDSLPRQSQSRPNSSTPQTQEKNRSKVDEDFDAIEDLKRMALEQQSSSVNRKELQPGSFDQIENDVSNAIKLGFNWLTRPL